MPYGIEDLRKQRLRKSMSDYLSKAGTAGNGFPKPSAAVSKTVKNMEAKMPKNLSQMSRGKARAAIASATGVKTAGKAVRAEGEQFFDKERVQDWTDAAVPYASNFLNSFRRPAIGDPMEAVSTPTMRRRRFNSAPIDAATATGVRGAVATGSGSGATNATIAAISARSAQIGADAKVQHEAQQDARQAQYDELGARVQQVNKQARAAWTASRADAKNRDASMRSANVANAADKFITARNLETDRQNELDRVEMLMKNDPFKNAQALYQSYWQTIGGRKGQTEMARTAARSSDSALDLPDISAMTAEDERILEASGWTRPDFKKGGTMYRKRMYYQDGGPLVSGGKKQVTDAEFSSAASSGWSPVDSDPNMLVRTRSTPASRGTTATTLAGGPVASSGTRRPGAVAVRRTAMAGRVPPQTVNDTIYRVPTAPNLPPTSETRGAAFGKAGLWAGGATEPLGVRYGSDNNPDTLYVGNNKDWVVNDALTTYYEQHRHLNPKRGFPVAIPRKMAIAGTKKKGGYLGGPAGPFTKAGCGCQKCKAGAAH